MCINAYSVAMRFVNYSELCYFRVVSYWPMSKDPSSNDILMSMTLVSPSITIYVIFFLFYHLPVKIQRAKQ